MREQLIEFLLENQNKFYRYAFTYVHHREHAMDMVQNSFLKALEQIHTLRNPDAMKTWFYRILTNECLQALKKHNGKIWWNHLKFRMKSILKKLTNRH